MKPLLRRYWTWYNDLQEPSRFLMAMLMMSPLFVASIVTELFSTPYKPFIMLGCVLFPIGLLCTRWWCYTKDKRHEEAKGEESGE